MLLSVYMENNKKPFQIDLLEQLTREKNHNNSIKRSREIINEIEGILNKRVIVYFAADNGADAKSMINDDDVFTIQDFLQIPSHKVDLVLILHTNGGFSLSAERIINVCRNYCNRNNFKFWVIVPQKAKSAGTIIALGADKIFLMDSAELGPVDPQFIIEDRNGNRTSEPAFLIVDTIEELIDDRNLFQRLFKKTKSVHNLSERLKLNLISQGNYPMYIKASNELSLSDKIIDKIALDKISKEEKIDMTDFDIFKDPHITNSHGRSITLSDLNGNGLKKASIINSIKEIFKDEEEKLVNFEKISWELYARKRFFLNDPENPSVKTIEDSNNMMLTVGSKIGQKNNLANKKT